MGKNRTTKDKSFYMKVDDQAVRVRAPHMPDKETTEALSALIKAATKKFKQP
jgi:hypothetical protein